MRRNSDSVDRTGVGEWLPDRTAWRIIGVAVLLGVAAALLSGVLVGAVCFLLALGVQLTVSRVRWVGRRQRARLALARLQASRKHPGNGSR